MAGVSGNGQEQLVEVLAGQRAIGRRRNHSARGPLPRHARRHARHGIRCLPEEPLRNACVPSMTVAENIAFRTYRPPPLHVRALGRATRSPAQGGGPLRLRISGEDPVGRRPHRAPLGRQRPAGGARAGLGQRNRGARRRQPLLRARLRGGRRDPHAHHGGAQRRARRCCSSAPTSTRSLRWPTASS